MPHALIVEDDANSAEMLAEIVAAEGFSTATAGTLLDARRQLAFRTPDIVLLDLTLPDGNGIELFDAVDRRDSEVVLITGQASVETSVQALRLGATDYLIKPVNVARLRAVLARAGAASDTRGQLSAQEDLVEAEGRFGRLWGRSAPMREVHRRIARVAPTAVTALITGESGTGKELVANTIHDLSRRAKGPFLAVNCGAISPQLIESELFGHEKGSFTGAVRQHRGFFERADGGTLFLDEVTEMPLELQVKLLRVLETGSFTPVGADQPVSTDVRIVAATNRAPLEAVAEGRLREDLYYRLAVFPIHLPPLRDRREDIPLIAAHFLQALNAREGSAKRFTERALQRLQAASWPGNVRELRNAVHRGFILADDSAIDAEDLPLDPLQPEPMRTSPAAAVAAQASPPVAASPTAPTAAPTTEAATATAPPTAPPIRSDEEPPAGNLVLPVGTSIAEAERRLILATLAHCGGHRERAAKMLGISAKTLYNRMKKYENEPAPGPEGDREPESAIRPPTSH